MINPLDDPRYIPQHPPTPYGDVPAVVARWGARSQLRWFDRFGRQLDPRVVDWDRYHCHSTLHLGHCCASCLEEQYEGYTDWYEGHCCCHALHALRGSS